METFNDLNLSPAMAQTVRDLGYTTPTPIQAQTLPLLLAPEPVDFLGLAATGTGKTLAFSIPILEKLNPESRGVQALILCPTRELAMQVSGQITALSKGRRIQVATIYGGAGYGDQIRSLKQGAQIVVATPGRLIDHLDRGTIQLKGVHTVVLDEADEMISMGFKEDLDVILQGMTEIPHQTWLFSATMSRDVRRVADQFLKDPKTVQVNKSEMLSGTVKQIYYMTKESDKPEVLCKLIDMNDHFYGLIFCQTKVLVTDLTTLLQTRGYKVDCLHGDKPQAERERILKRFKAKEMMILVCTDVAARGLDVKELTHVINYSIPRELDNYVHRIGRTGRSGKSGTALSLVTPSHFPLINRIEKLTKAPIERGQIPTRRDVAKKKVELAVQEILGVQVADPIQKLMEAQDLSSLEGFSVADLFTRFLTLRNSDLFTKLAERETPQRDPRENREFRPRGGEFRRRETYPFDRASNRKDDGGGARRSGGDFPRRERKPFQGRRYEDGPAESAFGSKQASVRGRDQGRGRPFGDQPPRKRDGAGAGNAWGFRAATREDSEGKSVRDKFRRKQKLGPKSKES